MFNSTQMFFVVMGSHFADLVMEGHFEASGRENIRFHEQYLSLHAGSTSWGCTVMFLLLRLVE